jgi:hypothetical protein
VCFYRARRGGGASAEVMAINGHGGPAGLDCIQGRGLNGEETEGAMGGSETPRLNCTLTAAILGGEPRGKRGGGRRFGSVAVQGRVLEVGGHPDMRAPTGSEREERGREKLGRARLMGRKRELGHAVSTGHMRERGRKKEWRWACYRPWAERGKG